MPLFFPQNMALFFHKPFGGYHPILLLAGYTTAIWVLNVYRSGQPWYASVLLRFVVSRFSTAFAGSFWYFNPPQQKGRTESNITEKPGPEVIKLFSCSTQLSKKFFLLINVKMPTTVGILTFMSGKNSLLHLSEPEKSWISWYFYTYEHWKFHAQLSWARKKFYNLGAWFPVVPR